MAFARLKLDDTQAVDDVTSPLLRDCADESCRRGKGIIYPAGISCTLSYLISISWTLALFGADAVADIPLLEAACALSI